MNIPSHYLNKSETMIIKRSKIILNSLCYNIIFHYQNLSNRFMYNVTFEKKSKVKRGKNDLSGTKFEGLPY